MISRSSVIKMYIALYDACQPFQTGSKSNPARHQPARQGQQGQIPTGQPGRVSRVKFQPCQAGQPGTRQSNLAPGGGEKLGKPKEKFRKGGSGTGRAAGRRFKAR